MLPLSHNNAVPNVAPGEGGSRVENRAQECRQENKSPHESAFNRNRSNEWYR